MAIDDILEPSSQNTGMVAEISVYVAPPPTGIVWNAADKSVNNALSNGDHTVSATAGGNYWGVRVTQPLTETAKAYFEFTFPNSAVWQGLGSVSVPLDPGAPGFTGGFAIDFVSTVLINEIGVDSFSFTNQNPSVYSIAADTAANKAWFRIDGGSWYPSGSDPATGTGGYSIPSTARIAMTFTTTGGNSTINTGDSPFVYPIPSGFVSYAGSVAGQSANIGIDDSTSGNYSRDVLMSALPEYDLTTDTSYSIVSV